MSSTYSTGGFSRFLEWIVRFVYINILWIIFTLIGLVIAGFAPSTAALFTVTRKWQTGEMDTAIFPLFWKTWRNEFVHANTVFYLLAVFGYALYLYGKLIQGLEGAIYTAAAGIWISVVVLFLIALLYLFPVFVHFDIKTFAYIKYALIIGITAPVQTLLMVLNTVAICTIFLLVPTLSPFFFGSVLSFTLMWIALRTFKKTTG